MNLTACRDCGFMVDPNSRGCPQCALNLEAERMIDKVVWRFIIPALTLLLVGIAVVVYFAVN
jgi:hypothetical protein